MRKVADKFLKESGTMVTSTCRTPLALTLQRKNKATPAMKRKEATHNGNKWLAESRRIGNVRTTGNTLHDSAIHRTRRPGQDEIATTSRRMTAVRYQKMTQSLTALDMKKKKVTRWQKDKRARSKKNDKGEEHHRLQGRHQKRKRRKDYKKARPWQSDRQLELIIGFIDLQCYINLQNEYYLLY